MAQLVSPHLFYPAGYSGYGVCYDLRHLHSWWKDHENPSVCFARFRSDPDSLVRFDTASLEAALQAGYDSDTFAVLTGLLLRSYVAGRDGSLTILRDSPLVCPITGATKVATGGTAVTLTSLNACTTNVTAGGITLPFYGCFKERTNLVTQSVFTGAAGAGFVTGWGQTGSTPSDMSRLAQETVEGQLITPQRIVATNGFSGFQRNMAANAAGTYTFSCWIKRTGVCTSGVRLYLPGQTPNATELLSAAQLTALPLGTWTLVSITRSIGVSAGQMLSICSQSAGLDCAVANPQCEAGSNRGPYVPTTGSSLTHATDFIQWTPPEPTSTSAGELVALLAPYLWASIFPDAGPIVLIEKSGGFPRLKAASPGDNKIEFQMKDATNVTRQTGSSGSLPSASGQIGISTGLWGADGYANDSWNGVLGSRSGPWPIPWVVDGGATLSYTVGTQTAGRVPCSMLSVFYTPGGLTAVERAALAATFAGQTIPFLTSISGGTPLPSASTYRRPGGVDRYRRPDGTSTFMRP